MASMRQEQEGNAGAQVPEAQGRGGGRGGYSMLTNFLSACARNIAESTKKALHAAPLPPIAEGRARSPCPATLENSNDSGFARSTASAPSNHPRGRSKPITAAATAAVLDGVDGKCPSANDLPRPAEDTTTSSQEGAAAAAAAAASLFGTANDSRDNYSSDRSLDVTRNWGMTDREESEDGTRADLPELGFACSIDGAEKIPSKWALEGCQKCRPIWTSPEEYRQDALAAMDGNDQVATVVEKERPQPTAHTASVQDGHGGAMDATVATTNKAVLVEEEGHGYDTLGTAAGATLKALRSRGLGAVAGSKATALGAVLAQWKAKTDGQTVGFTSASAFGKALEDTVTAQVCKEIGKIWETSGEAGLARMGEEDSYKWARKVVLNAFVAMDMPPPQQPVDAGNTSPGHQKKRTPLPKRVIFSDPKLSAVPSPHSSMSGTPTTEGVASVGLSDSRSMYEKGVREAAMGVFCRTSEATAQKSLTITRQMEHSIAFLDSLPAMGLGLKSPAGGRPTPSTVLWRYARVTAQQRRQQQKHKKCQRLVLHHQQQGQQSLELEMKDTGELQQLAQEFLEKEVRGGCQQLDGGKCQRRGVVEVELLLKKQQELEEKGRCLEKWMHILRASSEERETLEERDAEHKLKQGPEQKLEPGISDLGDLRQIALAFLKEELQLLDEWKSRTRELDEGRLYLENGPELTEKARRLEEKIQMTQALFNNIEENSAQGSRWADSALEGELEQDLHQSHGVSLVPSPPLPPLLQWPSLSVTTQVNGSSGRQELERHREPDPPEEHLPLKPLPISPQSQLSPSAESSSVHPGAAAPQRELYQPPSAFADRAGATAVVVKTAPAAMSAANDQREPKGGTERSPSTTHAVTPCPAPSFSTFSIVGQGSKEQQKAVHARAEEKKPQNFEKKKAKGGEGVENIKQGEKDAPREAKATGEEHALEVKTVEAAEAASIMEAAAPEALLHRTKKKAATCERRKEWTEAADAERIRLHKHQADPNGVIEQLQVDQRQKSKLERQKKNPSSSATTTIAKERPALEKGIFKRTASTTPSTTTNDVVEAHTNINSTATFREEPSTRAAAIDAISTANSSAGSTAVVSTPYSAATSSMITKPSANARYPEPSAASNVRIKPSVDARSLKPSAVSKTSTKPSVTPSTLKPSPAPSVKQKRSVGASTTQLRVASIVSMKTSFEESIKKTRATSSVRGRPSIGVSPFKTSAAPRPIAKRSFGANATKPPTTSSISTKPSVGVSTPKPHAGSSVRTRLLVGTSTAKPFTASSVIKKTSTDPSIPKPSAASSISRNTRTTSASLVNIPAVPKFMAGPLAGKITAEPTGPSAKNGKTVAVSAIPGSGSTVRTTGTSNWDGPAAVHRTNQLKRAIIAKKNSALAASVTPAAAVATTATATAARSTAARSTATRAATTTSTSTSTFTSPAAARPLDTQLSPSLDVEGWVWPVLGGSGCSAKPSPKSATSSVTGGAGHLGQMTREDGAAVGRGDGDGVGGTTRRDWEVTKTASIRRLKWIGRATAEEIALPWGNWRRWRHSEAWEKMVASSILRCPR